MSATPDQPATILVIDDTPTNLQILQDLLSSVGYRVLLKKGSASGLRLAKRRQPDLILLDIMMPGLDGYETCRQLKEDSATESIPVIFMSALDELEDKVRGFEAGGVDYVTKPFQEEEVLARVRVQVGLRQARGRLVEQNEELEHKLRVARELVTEARQRHEGLVGGSSEAVRGLRLHLEQVAPEAVPVLLTGALGAGEEAVARTLHALSARDDRPFILVDCLAARSQEREAIFGDPEKPQEKPGKWGLARQGSIFFDRLDALTEELRDELLGRLRTIQKDPASAASAPRVIVYAPGRSPQAAASASFVEPVALSDGIGEKSQTLEAEPALSLFETGADVEAPSRTEISCQDYGVRWARLVIPSLRERREDLEYLCDLFLKRRAARMGRSIKGLSARALERVLGYHWPGNLSELEGVLECALLASEGPVIEIADALLEAGRRVGSYQLLERIGVGGMGEVWSARHRLLVRPAAVKFIRPEWLIEGRGRDEVLEQFEREARVTAALESPHTVRLYDYGVTDDGSLYYVMEYLRGMDLGTLVDSYGPLEPARVVWLMDQTCRSLAEAHERGLVHRDLKPTNLFTCQLGTEHDILKVLDFGLVQELVRGRGSAGRTVEGTPAYMAPEMVELEGVDPRTDLYSLGCVMFWLLSGRRVFERSNVEALFVAHVRETPPHVAEVASQPIPDELAAIVTACLEKAPFKRPSTAQALRAMLLEVPLKEPWSEEAARERWRSYDLEPRPDRPAPTVILKTGEFARPQEDGGPSRAH